MVDPMAMRVNSVQEKNKLMSGNIPPETRCTCTSRSNSQIYQVVFIVISGISLWAAGLVTRDQEFLWTPMKLLPFGGICHRPSPSTLLPSWLQPLRQPLPCCAQHQWRVRSGGPWRPCPPPADFQRAVRIQKSSGLHWQLGLDELIWVELRNLERFGNLL
jgi:hypothetical protein